MTDVALQPETIAVGRGFRGRLKRVAWYFDDSEASRSTGARTVRRLTAAGKLRAVTVEGAVRYRASDVEDYTANLVARPMRERIATKIAVGARAGRVRAPGNAKPGHGTEHHREGAA